VLAEIANLHQLDQEVRDNAEEGDNQPDMLAGFETPSQADNPDVPRMRAARMTPMRRMIPRSVALTDRIWERLG
jgi:hypothetical protein